MLAEVNNNLILVELPKPNIWPRDAMCYALNVYMSPDPLCLFKIVFDFWTSTKILG